MQLARRTVLATLALALLAAPLAAEAHPAGGKVYRIALVHPNAAVAKMTEANPYLKVLFSELRGARLRRGAEPRRGAAIGEGRPARFPEFAREVVQLQPDLILLFSSRLALAFQAATTTIPIVGITGDPIFDKLVTNLARPGGNLTGFSTDTDESALGKLLELLKGVAPKVSRVAVLCPRATKPVWRAHRTTARALGSTSHR
jgi:ABC transporter substrate binding protein